MSEFKGQGPYWVDSNQEQGYIRIFRGERRSHVEEMLYWEHTEWEEDTELLFVIMEVVGLALTNTAEMDMRMVEMGKLKMPQLKPKPRKKRPCEKCM